MRIGISTLHVRPGKSGSHEPYLVNLIRGLSQIDHCHDIILFVHDQNKEIFFVNDKRFEYVIFPAVVGKLFVRIITEQFILPVSAQFHRVDVMHYPGTIGSLLLRKQDVVTVHHDSVTQRTSMSTIKNIYYDIALKIINKKAGRLIVPSQAYADELIKYFGYRRERVQPVHHGVNSIFRNVLERDVENCRKKYGIESNAILTVTNTLPHKNISNLLRAYHLLITNYHLENQLIMVGYIDDVTLMQILSEVSDDPEYIRSRINVIPFLPHEQLPPIYSNAAIFVYFSKVETFGMPLVEAMACGLPVVASDIPVHREVIQNAGLLVSPENPHALAEVLYKLLTNKEYQDLLAKSALKRSQQFSWEKTARQTLHVYENIWNSACQD